MAIARVPIKIDYSETELEKIRLRFLSMCKDSTENFFEGSACLEWQGALTDSGYGRFKLNGVVEKAHRVAMLLFTGRIVPNDLVVDHRCRNRLCQRHLEVCTQKENVLRIFQPERRFVDNSVENESLVAY